MKYLKTFESFTQPINEEEEIFGKIKSAVAGAINKLSSKTYEIDKVKDEDVAKAYKEYLNGTVYEKGKVTSIAPARKSIYKI